MITYSHAAIEWAATHPCAWSAAGFDAGAASVAPSPEDDPEVAALSDIVAALADLPTTTRARIARYVFERYDGVVAS